MAIRKAAGILLQHCYNGKGAMTFRTLLMCERIGSLLCRTATMAEEMIDEQSSGFEFMRSCM